MCLLPPSLPSLSLPLLFCRPLWSALCALSPDARCPMPDARYGQRYALCRPMPRHGQRLSPDARCPMPDARCPMHFSPLLFRVWDRPECLSMGPPSLSAWCLCLRMGLPLLRMGLPDARCPMPDAPLSSLSTSPVCAWDRQTDRCTLSRPMPDAPLVVAVASASCSCSCHLRPVSVWALPVPVASAPSACGPFLFLSPPPRQRVGPSCSCRLRPVGVLVRPDARLSSSCLPVCDAESPWPCIMLPREALHECCHVRSSSRRGAPSVSALFQSALVVSLRREPLVVVPMCECAVVRVCRRHVRGVPLRRRLREEEEDGRRRHARDMMAGDATSDGWLRRCMERVFTCVRSEMRWRSERRWAMQAREAGEERGARRWMGALGTHGFPSLSICARTHNLAAPNRRRVWRVAVGCHRGAVRRPASPQGPLSHDRRVPGRASLALLRRQSAERRTVGARNPLVRFL